MPARTQSSRRSRASPKDPALSPASPRSTNTRAATSRCPISIVIHPWRRSFSSTAAATWLSDSWNTASRWIWGILHDDVVVHWRLWPCDRRSALAGGVLLQPGEGGQKQCLTLVARQRDGDLARRAAG